MTTFDTECLVECYCTCLNYSLRKREWPRLQLKNAVPFRVEIDVGKQLDPIMTRSVNALLREYAVAGVALLRLLKEQNFLVDTVIDQFRSAYEKRLRRRARGTRELRVYLRRAAHSSPSRVCAACLALLRTSDTEIDALARRLVAAGRYFLSNPVLIPFYLIELYYRRLCCKHLHI